MSLSERLKEIDKSITLVDDDFFLKQEEEEKKIKEEEKKKKFIAFIKENNLIDSGQLAISDSFETSVPKGFLVKKGFYFFHGEPGTGKTVEALNSIYRLCDKWGYIAVDAPEFWDDVYKNPYKIKEIVLKEGLVIDEVGDSKRSDFWGIFKRIMDLRSKENLTILISNKGPQYWKATQENLDFFKGNKELFSKTIDRFKVYSPIWFSKKQRKNNWG